MIYEPVRTSNERGETLLHRPFVWEDAIIRPLVGLSLLGIGGLILYMFGTGGAPHPIGHGLRSILGWLILAGIFLLFGVVPIALGVQALMRNDEIVVDSAGERIEHRVKLAGQTVFRRRLSFGQFDRVAVEHSQGGFPASRSKYTVVATGARRFEVGQFYDALSATEFRDRLSMLMHLPQQRPSGGLAVE